MHFFFFVGVGGLLFVEWLISRCQEWLANESYLSCARFNCFYNPNHLLYCTEAKLATILINSHRSIDINHHHPAIGMWMVTWYDGTLRCNQQDCWYMENGNGHIFFSFGTLNIGKSFISWATGPKTSQYNFLSSREMVSNEFLYCANLYAVVFVYSILILFNNSLA